MIFTITTNDMVRTCKVIDVADLHQGLEHGLVYINADGSNGNTLISKCPKTDAFRYGPSNIEMVMRGWRPFVYEDNTMAA
ncbi:hypothetical protein [Botryobacter ruber]|uniref:hypothetical protein n=1 Tax=Botryobacter ruber TaxID=2171629 RepID=UPI000F64B1A8|nr:hypothetical protein [Botryobacter ruber]